MSSSTPKLPKYIVGGAIAAVIIVVLNILWYFLFETFTGIPPAAEISATGVFFASFIPPFIAAIAYWFVAKKIKMATVVFILGSAVLCFLSIIPLFWITLPGDLPMAPGFPLLTIPMHLIAGFAIVTVLPYWVTRSKK